MDGIAFDTSAAALHAEGHSLKPITELIVHITELVEAEGRALRTAAGRLGLGLSLTIVAAVLVLVGCIGVLAGVWMGVTMSGAGPAWASVITGVLSLAIAGGVLWGAARLSK